MKSLVIYHANCLDGFGAAWAASCFLSDASYVAMSYGDKLPDEVKTHNEIFILDFSIPREDIIELRNQGKKVVVVDHHASAKERLAGLEDCYFDMAHSGAVLSWFYFGCGSEPVPTMLHYIEDGDLYKFELPYSRFILNELHSIPKTFEEFTYFNHQVADRDGFIKIATKGQTIQSVNDKYIELAKKFAIKSNFEGYDETPIVNTIPHMSSDILNQLAKEAKYGFAVSWFQQADGMFKYSLRSVDERVMNVAKLAEDTTIKYNLPAGGGHPCAAGLISKTLFHLGI